MRLDRTAFSTSTGGWRTARPRRPGDVRRDDGRDRRTPRGGAIWHTVDAEDLPDVGTEVAGTIDWGRRFALMRTHTALHILCGVIWADYGIPVTGGNMEPLKGRLDFPFAAMSGRPRCPGRASHQRRDRARARDRRRLPAAHRRGLGPRADPHVRPPDPGRDRPVARDRHRRTRPAGRRRHASALDGRGRPRPRRRHGEQGQGQQADSSRGRGRMNRRAGRHTFGRPPMARNVPAPVRSARVGAWPVRRRTT